MTVLRRRTLDPWHDETGAAMAWVLFTLAAAGLITIMWALAGPVLADVFQQAIDRVISF